MVVLVLVPVAQTQECAAHAPIEAMIETAAGAADMGIGEGALDPHAGA